jgi:hypothetical protein
MLIAMVPAVNVTCGGVWCAAVVLCCVGQVYNFTSSGSWQEDKGWVQQLDVGWRVGAVRDAAYAALAEVNTTAPDAGADT